MPIIVEPFGITKCGSTAVLFTIKNKSGIIAKITNYGAALVSLMVPDANGSMRDVVLGYDDVRGYEATNYYMGATIGPHAGQIMNGKFTLNAREYQTVINDHEHTMHGGPEGIHKKLFRWLAGDKKIELFYTSLEGEAGFPGNVEYKVIYSLEDEYTLKMEYFVNADKDTIMSMTNHAYFNLDGEASGTVLKNKLQIFAGEYTKVDEQGVPTGEIEKVKNTPYDFSYQHEIGEFINCDDEQLKWCKGYDHNWILNNEKAGELNHACKLASSDGIINMNIYTNQPGLQMYSGNYLDESEAGKNGVKYGFRSAICLESQIYPNGMNLSNFITPVLKKDIVYHYISVYSFE